MYNNEKKVEKHMETQGPQSQGQQGGMDLIYTIDMENDVIKTITFDVDGQARGSLIFSYLQSTEKLENQLTEPVTAVSSQPPIQQSPGIRWLIYLAQGNLGK